MSKKVQALMDRIYKFSVLFVSASLAAFFTGCFIMILAYGAQFVGRGLAQFSLSISGMCGGPLLGLFLCGFLLPWCNSLVRVQSISYSRVQF